MNIYVSNLSWGTQSDSLHDLFDAYGEVVSANIINDRETGRSRGLVLLKCQTMKKVKLLSMLLTRLISKAKLSA